MCGVQFRDELSSLHTRVLSKRTWQRLKGLSKLLNSILLQARAGLSHKNVMFVSLVRKCCNHRIRDERAVNGVYLSVGSELLGQFDLCGTCSRYQPLVLGNKHAQHWKHCSLRQNIWFSMYICHNLSLCWHTLTKSLKVLTPSSTALSMSSIRLSVEPLITTVEMAPSSLSVKGNTPLKLNITTTIRCDNIRTTADYTVFENHHLRVPNFG